jgi:hypothetical protein
MLVEFGSAHDGSGVQSVSSAGCHRTMPSAGRSSNRVSHRHSRRDIIFDKNDSFGDGVNIASRLEGIGELGGVCISDDAQRQVRGKVDVGFDDLGPKTLKNITEPTRAWRVRSVRGIAIARNGRCCMALLHA